MKGQHEDWMSQSDFDLDHAELAVREGHFEWAAFAALQAAEKASRALHLAMGNQPAASELTVLLDSFPGNLKPPANIMQFAKGLEYHYLAARYPTLFPHGTPGEHYTEQQAKEAIAEAEIIIDFCYRSIQTLPD